MVGYDSQNNALTLGDDDSLKVGEYELQYDSTNDEFQAEYEPTGDTKSIPRSTSGSLVPQGFADVVSQGEVLADNGEIYTSVQTAVDNSTGFVFIGPGTFNENVTISTQGLTLQGSGYDTLIDGGTTNHAVILDNSDITVSNLSVQTTAGAGNNFDGFKGTSNGVDITITDCVIRDSDRFATRPFDGTNWLSGWVVDDCVVENADGAGISVGSNGILRNCTVINTRAGDALSLGLDDSIGSNNVVQSAGRDGLRTTGNDTILIGNRISNATERGINIAGTDSIVANNRISDSGISDITDNGTGTLLDGNLTGASN